jgi:hypothetical protein
MKYTDQYGVMHESTYVKDIAIQYEDNNGYIFNHGLNAYVTDTERTVEDNLIDILNNDSMEICCSYTGKRVGNIGVELEGTCMLAMTRDVMSRIDKSNNCHRLIYNDMLQYKHTGKLSDIKIIDAYGEAIVTKYRVKCLWVNPYTTTGTADARTILMEAKRLAAKYNLELKIVMDTTI